MDAVELRVARGMIDAAREKVNWLAKSASSNERMRLQAEILAELAGIEMLIDNIGVDK